MPRKLENTYHLDQFVLKIPEDRIQTVLLDVASELDRLYTYLNDDKEMPIEKDYDRSDKEYGRSYFQLRVDQLNYVNKQLREKASRSEQLL